MFILRYLEHVGALHVVPSFSIFRKIEQWVHSDFIVWHFSIFCMLLPILELVPLRSPNISMHHFLNRISDLNGIRGRDILEAAKENKVRAIRHFIRSDVNSVQKTDDKGTGLEDVAWSPWRFGDAMTWCNGMQWPGVVSFHFVVPRFDLKVEFLW